MGKRIGFAFLICCVLTAGAFASELGIGSSLVASSAPYNDNTAAAQQPEVKAEYEYTALTNNTIKLTKCNITDASIVIPEKIDSKTVTAIGKYAFDSAGLRSVTIPQSVTFIEEKAIGFHTAEGQTETDIKNTAVTIVCHEGTAAQKYAEENGFKQNVTKHSYKLTKEKSPTCTKDGSKVYTCSCGDSYTETVKMLGHSYTVKGKTVKPTLTSKGYTVYKCSRCSKTTKKNYVAKLKSISKVKVSSLKNSYTYTGKKIKPVITVKYGGTTLKKWTDYTLKYSHIVKIGTSTITIKGKGKYTGTKIVTYKIVPIKISKVKVSGIKDSYVYTGKKIKPEITLTYGSMKLKKGKDYTLKYRSTVNKGTASVTITGKGRFTGKKVIRYSIKARSIRKATIKGFKNYLSYNGYEKTQSLKLTFKGRTLKQGTDYTLSYKNNVNRGTATVVIKGKGNFRKSVTKDFHIVRTGWYTSDAGNTYYYNSKGKLATDKVVKIDGSYYCFGSDSVMVKGWRKIAGSYYLFDRLSGKRVENTTVDGITVDNNGKAQTDSWALEKIDTMMRARSIMLDITGNSDTMEQKRLKCFNWVLAFPYHRYRLLKPIYTQKGWEMTFANDIFIDHQGCCVSESSAIAFLFREIGYTDVYVCHDSGHSWVMVGDYLFDSVFAEAKSFDKNYNVIPYDYRVNPLDKRFIG